MRRIVIEIERLIGRKDLGSRVECEYLYHRRNEGQLSLVELAQFAVYCRRCQESFCVKSCPREALERREDGVVKRYNLRCVGCGSCALACPFGTIFAEAMQYIAPGCDLCLQWYQEDAEHVPLCVKTAPDGALRLVDDGTPLEEDSEFAVGDRLIVRAPNWRHKENRA